MIGFGLIRLLDFDPLPRFNHLCSCLGRECRICCLRCVLDPVHRVGRHFPLYEGIDEFCGGGQQRVWCAKLGRDPDHEVAVHLIKNCVRPAGGPLLSTALDQVHR